MYTSTDSGATWTARTSTGRRDWVGIASSSDGTKLAAINTGGYIYTSNDSGATWIAQTSAGRRDWVGIASSSDGTKLAAVVNWDFVYTSNDSGATWTAQTSAGSRPWWAIASSTDGTKLAAVGFDSYIYTSSDSGATWTERTNAGSRKWRLIASSSDGTKLAAVANEGYIYTSADSGATWNEQTNAGARKWRSISISADGTKIFATVYSGYIYISNDSGATWTEQINAGIKDWWSISTSADGMKISVNVIDGYVYTAQTVQGNTLTKASTGSGTVTASTGTITWSGNTGTASYTSGTSVTLTATPSSGSTFAGWSGACSGTTTTCSVAMSSAISVTAMFSANIAVGGFQTVALKNDGTVWTWGGNQFGSLGNGANTDSYSPVQVSGLTGVIAISAGEAHTVALKSDGTVWTWGINGNGQLGNGTNVFSNTPVEVSGLTGVTAIAAGSYHTVALKSDGTVWTWGYNGYGQLGNVTDTGASNTPLQVSALTGVMSIASGSQHTIALKNDGTVWVWGYNNEGELGNSTNTNSRTPIQVSGLTGVAAIAGGSNHTIVLKNDGTVWAWGSNSYGELGNGTSANSNKPVQVSGLTGAIAIAGGAMSTMVLKNDGTIWDWGLNQFGELGNGTNTNSNKPVQVSSLTGVTAIAAEKYHTVAMKSDGTIWDWGYNGLGQLGDGTTTNRNTPVQVVFLASYKVIPTAGSNGTISPSTVQTVTSGKTTSFTVTPSTGYTASVTGCGGSLSGNTYTTGVITADCNVSATFSASSYKVTPSAGSNGTISPSAVQTVTSGKTTSFTVTPSSGYTASVSGCGGSLSGNTYTTGAITADCTVAATFSAASYKVTPSAGSNGTISPSTVQTVASGKTTSFTVTPSSGYTAAVGGTCGGSLNGTTYTTSAITADCTVAATFSASSYKVTPSAGANGTISPSTIQTVASGKTTSFTVTPSTGYTAAVGGTCGGSLNGTTYTTSAISADCTVAATFTGNSSYKVTPTAGANGSISPSTVQTVASGKTTSFTVVPNVGYTATVTGCGGSLSGNTYTTGAITSDCTVATTFTAQQSQQYTITVNTSGTGSGTVSPSSGTYNSGANVNLTATPASGSTFTGWSGDCSWTFTSCNILMSSNKTVTANFDIPTSSAPSVPTSLSISKISSGYRLSWNNVPNATSYKIYWGNDGSVNETNKAGILTTSSTPYDHTGMVTGYFYYYRIKACNIIGCSDLSSIVSDNDPQSISINNPQFISISNLSLSTNRASQMPSSAQSNTQINISASDLIVNKGDKFRVKWSGFSGDVNLSLYKGKAWSGDVSTTAPKTGYMDLDTTGWEIRSDYSVLAELKADNRTYEKTGILTVKDPNTPTYKLTVTNSGANFGSISSDKAGIDCGDNCSATYVANANVTLTATPINSLYKFDGWKGNECDVIHNNGTHNRCVVTMSGIKNVTANFSPKYYAKTNCPNDTAWSIKTGIYQNIYKLRIDNAIANLSYTIKDVAQLQSKIENMEDLIGGISGLVDIPGIKKDDILSLSSQAFEKEADYAAKYKLGINSDWSKLINVVVDCASMATKPGGKSMYDCAASSIETIIGAAIVQTNAQYEIPLNSRSAVDRLMGNYYYYCGDDGKNYALQELGLTDNDLVNCKDAWVYCAASAYVKKQNSNIICHLLHLPGAFAGMGCTVDNNLIQEELYEIITGVDQFYKTNFFQSQTNAPKTNASISTTKSNQVSVNSSDLTVKQGDKIRITWSGFSGNVNISVYKGNNFWTYATTTGSGSGSQDLDTTGWEVRSDYYVLAELKTDTSVNAKTGILTITAAATKPVANPSSVSVVVGGQATSTVTGGSTPYTAASSNTNIATASISGSTVTITGVVQGSTTVTVTDKNNQTAPIAVTVTAPSVSLSATSVTQGATVKATWSGFSGTVNVAVYKGSTFWTYATTTGAGSGSQDLDTTGWDVRSDYKIYVELKSNTKVNTWSPTLIVNAKPTPPTVNPSSVSVVVGGQSTSTISGGTSPYTAVSSNTNIATASISGSTVTITGVAQGSTTVTVTDKNNQTAQIAVTVTAPSVSLSATSVTQGATVKATWSGFSGTVNVAVYKGNTFWAYATTTGAASGSQDLDTTGWEVRSDYKIYVELKSNTKVNAWSPVLTVNTRSYKVTPSSGSNGSINPSSVQTVISGSKTSFTVAPNSGYTTSVGGTCSGTLSNNTYTTAAITADCTVVASFAPCTYSLSQTNNSIAYGGGSGSVSVNASNSSCSWTAASNVNWITKTSGGGNGNGSVSYSVAANTSTSTCQGTMTIAGQTFTINQAAAPVPIPSTPSSPTISPISGGFSLTWSSVSNATSYQIYWGTSNSVTESSNQFPPTSSTVYSHTGLSKNSTYYYRMKACNSSGCSSLSSPASYKKY